ERRREITDAIQGSVWRTLDKLEADSGWSRQGKAGKDQVPAALTFALFQHHTSRALDPQLHWHCLLMNVGVRPDGTTGSLHTRPLFDLKIQLGTFFRTELAAELTKRLGLEIKQTEKEFEIKGISKELCKHFSARRLEVEAFMEKAGTHGGKAAKVAA